LAMSKPTVVISMVDGSFSSLHSTARAWHIDAVRGRPPHQIHHRIVTYRSLGYEIIATDASGALAGSPPETLADRKRDRDWART